LCLVPKHGVARLHLQAGYTGETCDKALADSLAEVLGFGITARVDEGQDGQRVNRPIAVAGDPRYKSSSHKQQDHCRHDHGQDVATRRGDHCRRPATVGFFLEFL